MEKDRQDQIKSLKRVIKTLSKEEAKVVYEAFLKGEKTGYASIDEPWMDVYKDMEYVDYFRGTTPYQGIVKANSDFKNEAAIKYFGNTISFGELIKNSDKIAKSLQEYGIKKGDYVTVCSTTTPEVAYLFYGISKIGAVANLISPFYEPKDLMARINECKSNLVIMVDEFYPKYKDVLNMEKDKNVIVAPLMNSSPIRFIKPKYKIDPKTNEIDWKTFVKDGRRRPDAEVDPYAFKKPQAMVYSSGSTGPSKGIVLSVDAFQTLLDGYKNSGFDTTRGQKVFQNIPPWHSTGISLGLNFPLSFGVTVCTDPRFDHKVFTQRVSQYDPEYILTNTSMYQGFTMEECKEILDKKPPKKLKYPVEGGELVTKTDIKNIEESMHDYVDKSVRLLNGYGQCECGATVTTDITTHKFSDEASGIPLPKITKIAIFDDNYRELKYNTRGNIFVKTEIGMNEYFNKPKETEEYFYTDINGDVWYTTGDIGYIKEDGSLVVLGRKIDISNINGVEIYNFDIERAILNCNKVKLCEVQTHPNDDNKIVAHIVWEKEFKQLINENPELEMEYIREIQETVRQVMNLEEAVPYNFCIRDTFPSAHSGKRDTAYIKNNVEGLIDITPKKLKKIV